MLIEVNMTPILFPKQIEYEIQEVFPRVSENAEVTIIFLSYGAARGIPRRKTGGDLEVGPGDPPGVTEAWPAGSRGIVPRVRTGRLRE